MMTTTTSKFSGDKISAFYSVNSQSFESMSFSEGIIKGDVGSWSYQFYLKDHLGSTRMALTDGDQIACATMYQPYGTMDEVEDIGAGVSDPVRQRFTTKEFDEDGDANSAPGMGLFYFGARYYDADIGKWVGVDPGNQFFDSYGYSGNGFNPITGKDPDGAFFGIGEAALAGLGLGVLFGWQYANAPAKNDITYRKSDFSIGLTAASFATAAPLSSAVSIALRTPSMAFGITKIWAVQFSPVAGLRISNALPLGQYLLGIGQVGGVNLATQAIRFGLPTVTAATGAYLQYAPSIANLIAHVSDAISPDPPSLPFNLTSKFITEFWAKELEPSINDLIDFNKRIETMDNSSYGNTATK